MGSKGQLVSEQGQARLVALQAVKAVGIGGHLLARSGVKLKGDPEVLVATKVAITWAVD